MKKAAVIYWSGTGNTEAMANAVLDGMKNAGADAVLLTASDVDASAVGGYDAVALGCPAMGSEVLEDMEFEPMFEGCKSALKGKRVALFGSYGWGGGEWMQNWERDCRSSGIQAVSKARMLRPSRPMMRPLRPVRRWARRSSTDFFRSYPDPPPVTDTNNRHQAISPLFSSPIPCSSVTPRILPVRDCCSQQKIVRRIPLPADDFLLPALDNAACIRLS